MEQWKDILDYEGYYQVSNLGRVKSLKRQVFNKRLNRNVNIPEKILKIGISRGYPSINLCKNGVCINNDIHVLVATYFIPNPENKKCVNHKNGIKTDNNSENLEWTTYSENTKHAFKTGLQTNNRISGEKHGLSKLKLSEVIEIRRLSSEIKISQRKLSEIFKVSQSTIGSIINYETWK